MTFIFVVSFLLGCFLRLILRYLKRLLLGQRGGVDIPCLFDLPVLHDLVHFGRIINFFGLSLFDIITGIPHSVAVCVDHDTGIILIGLQVHEEYSAVFYFRFADRGVSTTEQFDESSRVHTVDIEIEMAVFVFFLDFELTGKEVVPLPVKAVDGGGVHFDAVFFPILPRTSDKIVQAVSRIGEEVEIYRIPNGIDLLVEEEHLFVDIQYRFVEGYGYRIEQVHRTGSVYLHA